MKKLLSLFTLSIFCITSPAFSNELLPPKSNDTESPPDLSSPSYATDDAPFRERTETEPTGRQKSTQIAAIVIGTLAALTVGLIDSGADTGRHIRPSEERNGS